MDFLKSKINTLLDDDNDGNTQKNAMNEDSDDEDNHNKVKNDKDLDLNQNNTSKQQQNQNSQKVHQEEKITDRLFLRNLPYTTSESDIQKLFSKYGTILEIHLPLDEARRLKGFGFVRFETAEQTKAAFAELDGISFQGRLLHILFARPGRVLDSEANEDSIDLTYKEKKEKERKQSANKTVGWNSSYVRSDAVIDSLAAKFQVSKGEILSRDDSNMAVQLALGETHLITENKEYLKSKGVDLSALETQNSATKSSERSKTAILVKNLPFDTEEGELTQLFGVHGDLTRIVLPPSRSIAVIEFVTSNDAKRAFQQLAYRKFKHIPLYLEWAPLKIFIQTAESSNNKPDKKSELDIESVKGSRGQENIITPSIYVKNLNFSTTEEELKQYFESIGPVRTVRIPKKQLAEGSKKLEQVNLSMGYGFVEFLDLETTENALKQLQGSILKGHALELKLSQNKSKSSSTSERNINVKGQKETKILIRNVPFQTNRKELKKLFEVFGKIKTLRLPKKPNGDCRGFAFIEFLTHQEAENAMQSLYNTHFYGRHLVLEWAEDANDLETLREKASRDISINEELDKDNDRPLKKFRF